MKEDTTLKHSEFFFVLFNHYPDALVLLDPDMKIKFSNLLFHELFHFKEEVNFDEILGHALGCKDIYQSVSRQDLKINCSSCKLKNAVKKTITSKKTQKSDTIVLQTMQADSEGLKLIQFQTIYLNYKNEEFVLLKLNDLTKFGNDTLNLMENSKNDD